MSLFSLSGCSNTGGPGELDEEIALTIRQDYLDTAVRNDANTVDEVIIHQYYGTYNENVVLSISGTQSVIIDVHGGTETILDKTFTYPQPGYQILVWSSGSFSKLLEAYKEGLLTDSNIESIWNIYSQD